MEQNKLNTAKIVAMKMAERKNQQSFNESGKRKGGLIIIDSKPPVADATDTIILYTLKLRAVDEGQPTAYFSLGLSNIEVVNRLISIVAGIDQKAIDGGTLSAEEWKTLDQKLPALLDAPLYIDDTPEMTLAEVKGKIIDLIGKGVKFVVIDNAQKLIADGMATDAILSDINESAKTIGYTVIAVVN